MVGFSKVRVFEQIKNQALRGLGIFMLAVVRMQMMN